MKQIEKSERHVEKSSSTNKYQVEINSNWEMSDNKIQGSRKLENISNCGAQLEKDLMIN